MVPLGDCPGVVTPQLDHDPIPTIRPVGMMVLFLGDGRHLGHEIESGGEVGEPEFSTQTTVPFFPV